MLCEGQTEREFCQSVVAPALRNRDVLINPSLAGKPGRERGGVRHWSAYRPEIIRHARSKRVPVVGLLVDFYGMPSDWPGREDATKLQPGDRGVRVERALRADLANELPDRFVPCVQVHEFESLLFVDHDGSADVLAGLVRAGGAAAVQTWRREVVRQCGGSVESINQNRDGAPSRRLATRFGGYEKVIHGVAAAQAVGIEALRERCRWLDRWMTRLEALGRADHG